MRDSIDIRFDAGLSDVNRHGLRVDDFALARQIGLDEMFAMNAVTIAESGSQEKLGKLGVLSMFLAAIGSLNFKGHTADPAVTVFPYGDPVGCDESSERTFACREIGSIETGLVEGCHRSRRETG